MYDPMLEAAVNKGYKRLWFRIFIEAVYDYVLHKSGEDHDTASYFLSRRENLDLCDLNMTSEELIDILDHVSTKEMRKRRTEYYIRSESELG